MSSRQRPPVVLFAYNRLDHLSQTVAALKQNNGASDTSLIVFCDGPRSEDDKQKISDVRSFLERTTGFASIELHFSDENKGLAPSVINGVSHVLKDFPSVIVLEDDIVTSPDFLDFMNLALIAYEGQEMVASISGYIDALPDLPETFFSRKGGSWGWATWRRVWDRVDWNGEALLEQLEASQRVADFDFGSGVGFSNMLKAQVAGKNSSWAIRFYVWSFLGGMVHLTPGKSLVQNIGHDGSGTHCDPSDFFDTDLAHSLPAVDPNMPVKESPTAYEAISRRLQNEHGRFGVPSRKRGFMRRLFTRLEGKLA